MKIKPYSFRKLLKDVEQLNDKVIVLPTDTVIGVVSRKPELIFHVKKRQPDKKLVLFINDVDQIKTLSSNEKEVLKKYWPGQLTIIKNKEAYRVPASKKILSLIKRIGPLYSSSANLSGRTPIIKTIDTINEFGFDQLKNIYVVKGKQKDHYPSTIVDFDNLTVLRRGRVDGQKVLDDLKEIK